MNIYIRTKYDPTYNRAALPLPIEDPRIKNQNREFKLNWEDLQQTRKEMLQAYQVTVSKIASRISSTDFYTLRHMLMYEWYFPSSVVEDLIRFISTNETKHIEFEEVDGCRKDVIFLKPRIKLSVPIAEHSVWIPHRH